jgi:hypothetical protein
MIIIEDLRLWIGARTFVFFGAMTTISPSQSTLANESIKIGMDAHAQY